MKTKYFYLAALAGLTLASCSSDDFIAEAPPVEVENTMSPIMFSSSKNNFTRGENDFVGAKAAELLGNKFVVMGFKGAETTTPGSVVFDNYLVKYIENSAHTTESNTNNWEYVLPNGTSEAGVLIPTPHATTNGITSQTIKYWDYTQPQYDFLAWSTGTKTAIYSGEPTSGKVLVTNIQPNSKDKTWRAADNTNEIPARVAYTFTGKAADLSECYISDIVTVNKIGDAGVGEVTGYNKPVTLRFRQLGTKVRIGIYETVPGYSVKNVEFYRAAATALPNENPDNAYLFTTAENEIYTEGTYHVYFPTIDKPNDADNNQAHVIFKPKDGEAQSTTVDWGKLDYTIRQQGEHYNDEIYLGRTSNTASMAGVPADNYYKVFLPNQSGTNLNLRVNYTLESIDGSGEEINVKGATAQVPSIYTEWKPGYAYTYLFKISDKTNGYTGVYNPTNPDGNTFEANPAGLYPITFDAVVVNADEDATQETITLISTPSITSYQKGSTVVNKNEYTTTGNDNDIFVTVNDGTPGTATCTAVANGTKLTAGNVYYTSAAGAGAFIATGSEESDGTNYFVFTSVDNTILGTGTLQTLTNKADLYKIPDGMTEAEVIDALSYYYTKDPEYIVADPQPTSEAGITSYYILNGDTYTAATSYEGSGTTYYTKVEPVYTEASPQPNKDNFDENTYYTKEDQTYTKATTYAETGTPTYYTKAITSFTTKGRSNKVLTGATYSLVDQVVFGADGNVIPVAADQALRFDPAANTTYAFVYTQSTGTDTKIYQAKTFASNADVKGYYRYKLVSAGSGDAQPGVKYFPDENAAADMITPFLGQTVSNLYTRSGSSAPYTYTIASGYAQTGTKYYYTTDNGMTYPEAENIAYASFESTALFYKDTNDAWQQKIETTPINGRAYYKRSGSADNYVYSFCVILPQQTDSWFVINGTDTTVADNITACGTTDKAVNGMTYFDKYTKNNGVRYVKVIKIE